MKKPNLSYNNYFPFYTRNTFGSKKYCYRVETTMHISRERGISISLEYELKKPKKISIKRITDRIKLSDTMYKDTHITYTDFAKDINTAYRHISGAIKILMPEPAYRVILAALATYLKFNPDMELKVDSWSSTIELSYGKFDYRIAGGKKVDNKEPSIYTDSEEDAIMKRIDASLRAFNDATTFQEVYNDYFNKRLDNEWDYFVEYFSAPKCIRKNEYRL